MTNIYIYNFYNCVIYLLNAGGGRWWCLSVAELWVISVMGVQRSSSNRDEALNRAISRPLRTFFVTSILEDQLSNIWSFANKTKVTQALGIL